MTSLSSAVLLALWESNHHMHPIGRALALLDAAWPEVGVGNWARAPVGQRDCSLLGLREALFGAELTTAIHCPVCGGRLESTSTPGDVGVRNPAAPFAPPRGRLEDQDYEIDY